ncbi:hypothetical protein AOLI_G00004820 [Acnodon oligacanthus]
MLNKFSSVISLGVDQHRDIGSSIPEIWQELPFVPPTLCGPLAGIWEFCQGLDRSEKNFAYTYENWCSDGLKLPPQYFACATAVACIKHIGASIGEVKVYLRTESSHTSVQNIMLQTRVSRMKKCVFIESDGHFWSHESSHAHILETPAPSVYPMKPRGPPPGF